ncbi:hypothetical protein [Agromyces soli]|uniref:Uncharacterized protein n=1 Tax=Agromyces soli TaxID=659012 RepID=A0ABY4AUZ5_9MICO|nr:hypothetical protein [Agromyces soli]UOE26227.1 hypothetical protein MTP13_00145 [Agromyces soli]
MTSTHPLEHLRRDEPTRRGAGLSGREVRRLVDLVVTAEREGRQVTALSQMVPGLGPDDARVIRDELLRRRTAAGERAVAIVSVADGEPAFASTTAVVDGTTRVSAAPELLVQPVAGVHLDGAALRELLHGSGAPAFAPGSARVGLATFRSPFRREESALEDLLAANGGLCGVAVAARPGVDAADFALRSGGRLLVSGRAPHASDSWAAALETVVAALERCAPLRELGAGLRDAEAPFPGLVFATALGEAIALDAGDAVDLELAGRHCATVSATSDRHILMGDPE